MGDEQFAQRLQVYAPRRPRPEDFIGGDRLVGLPARCSDVGRCGEVRLWKLGS